MFLLNPVAVRNWVLFNITSPLYGVVYKWLWSWIHTHLEVRFVDNIIPKPWAWRVYLTKGFSIYTNERLDYQYIQWLGMIRMSWDAADVYHLYVVPPLRQHLAMANLWYRHNLLFRTDTGLRIYYAYRHSIRSGYGVGAFLNHYINYPY